MENVNRIIRQVLELEKETARELMAQQIEKATNLNDYEEYKKAKLEYLKELIKIKNQETENEKNIIL